MGRSIGVFALSSILIANKMTLSASFHQALKKCSSLQLSNYAKKIPSGHTAHYFFELSSVAFLTRNNDDVFPSSEQSLSSPLNMENIYQEWTLQDDQLLYEKRNLPTYQLASLLGRGLNGVQSRLSKLKDVNSFAYYRLFTKKSNASLPSFEISTLSIENKLIPINQVLQRIKWDPHLNPQDFFVLHYDRLENKILECKFDQKNESVTGQEELFIFAIPEHRITQIKYKERIVWDKQNKLDYVFGSMNGQGIKIEEIINSYDTWKREESERIKINNDRQRYVMKHIQYVLGSDTSFDMLRHLSKQLQERHVLSNINMSGPQLNELSDGDVYSYVQQVLTLFQSAMKNYEKYNITQENADNFNEFHIKNSAEASSIDEDMVLVIPKSDYEALDLFSKLVSLLPDQSLRERILKQILLKMEQIRPENNGKKTASKIINTSLPPLDETELSEQFVRGSGAGGQKINKTSNKVILVHIPTEIRVECQETRSLQQNRKIARKRMQLKLDEYWNGQNSKVKVKASELAKKKAKAKARSSARHRKLKEERNMSETDSLSSDFNQE